ncbi:MAG: ribonuclease H-like domain-containing protein, partial [Eubacterium sp.]
MIRQDDYIKEALYQSKAFDMYFSPLQCGVLDIETTGLRPYKDQVILIGFVLPEKDAEGNSVMHAVQLFAQSPEEEKDLLLAADKILQTLDCVITYNGRRFDIPFLQTRAKKHHLTIAAPYDLDLYQVIRNYSPLHQVLPSLRQKSIEIYMGLSDSRDDEIDGGESVRLYMEYLNTGEDRLLQTILLHNHDDILQLLRILPILESCDLHRAMFHLGLPSEHFITGRIHASERSLTANVNSRLPISDAVVFPTSEKPYHLTASSKSRETELEFIPEHPSDGVAVLDAASILGCSSSASFERDFAFSKLPGIESGYLIYAHHRRINYLGINGFLLAFLKTL